MLKRDITYEDYNGDTVTDTHYFNLTQTEILELEVSKDGGLDAFIKRVIETKQVAKLMEEFKKIVLASYGVRSEDGKRFIKSDELRLEFSQTAAYDALFMELATDANSAAEFIKGVIPTKLRGEVEKAGIKPETVELPQPEKPTSSATEAPVAWQPPSSTE